ncbi:MAG: HAD hydrolase-like protein [Candidatus Aenigmarchaeota archaeon]|nr:HAD hydrolase-like protein [Candidatus Aenigmarchaeota archaeon]
MIKAIFFDFDGVLTLNNSGTAQTCEYISENTSIDYNLLIDSFKNHKLDLLLGYKKYSDVLPKINNLINNNIDNKLLEEAFLSTPKNSPMFDLVKYLRSRGYKTGIITDNPIERFNVLEKEFNLDLIFDSIIISSKVHSLKTEFIIFETALNSFNLNPSEIVFIDNSKKNLEIPSKMGINTIYYDDKENNIELLISDLKGMDVD